MIEQILLSSDSFEGVREMGGFGQPLHSLYPQIRAVLANELGPEVAYLLAEPVVDRAGNRIDWYTEGDPEHKPVVLSDLPEDQRQPILARVHELIGRGRELEERYAASGEARRRHLGAILHAVLATPAEDAIFLVDGRPVLTRWSFVPDRPWEAPAGPVRRPVTPPVPALAEPPRDVVIPEIPMPELATTTVKSDPLAEFPVMAEPPLESSSTTSQPKPALPEPMSEPAPEPALEPAPEPAPEPVSEPAPEPAPEPPAANMAAAPPLTEPGLSRPSEPVAAAVPVDPPPVPKPAPAFPFHYVVVGSRYFWSVVALAFVLALGAALWWGGTGRPAPHPGIGEAARLPPAVELERALTEARRGETELRTRLERLLVQLAERRGRCPLPAGADATALREPGITNRLAILPAEPGARSGERRETAPPTTATSTETEKTARIQPQIAASNRESGVAPPALVASPDGSGQEKSDERKPGTEPPTANRAAVPPAAPGRETGGASVAAAPAVSERAIPPIPVPQPSPPSAAQSPVAAASPPVTPPSQAPTGAKPPARTLEEVLTEREPAPATSLPPSAPAEPPVKTEPTPEERQEFANRLSAVGAATGEITASLSWNSQGDLDLVVRCPSGRQLDYRNPAECGGTLDRDANTTRASLSDRPVENAFWSAGQAAPGTYEIAVRYAPRKDEQTPRETPFRVLLKRGDQESMFKGTIHPNAIVPVTTFTVGR